MTRRLGLALQLIAGAALCGCAAEPLKGPSLDVFERPVAVATPMPGPVPLPARPTARLLHDTSGDLFAFDQAGAKRLSARDAVCEGNTEIAAECADGYQDLQRSHQLLLEQARAVQAQHNYMAERWAQAETELQRREREQFIETWVTRALVLGLIVSSGD